MRRLIRAELSTSVGWTARRMLNDIYSRRILELAADIPLQGTLPDAHGSAKAHSKLCGSTVTVYLKLDGNVISAFTHEVKACALGQASSSIMGRHVIGSTAGELRVLREDMHRMLKAGGDPPSGKWADLALLEPAREPKSPSRLDPPHFRRCGRCACPSPSGQ